MIQESSIEPSERDTTVQHTRAAPQSPQLKGVDHPSPVSVLEVPSGEDDVLSGHECFEQISADLQGSLLGAFLIVVSGQ